MIDQKVGRLAMRQEGNTWNAYYAMPDSMEEAIFLGSIKIRLVDKPDRKEAFLSLMRECVADMLEEVTGTRPTYLEGAKPAPESERSGNA